MSLQDMTSLVLILVSVSTLVKNFVEVLDKIRTWRKKEEN